MKKIIFWGILILIMIIVFVGGILFYRGSSQKLIRPMMSGRKAETIKTILDKTTDWKTYRDSERKFLIKYPPDWKKPDEFGMNIYLYSKDENIQIRTAGIFSPLNGPEKFISRRINLTKKLQRVSGLKVKNVLFNNISGVQLSYHLKSKKNLFKDIVFFRKKGSDKICEVEVTVFGQEKQYLPIVNQIFSTFRFLK